MDGELPAGWGVWMDVLVVELNDVGFGNLAKVVCVDFTCDRFKSLGGDEL